MTFTPAEVNSPSEPLDSAPGAPSKPKLNPADLPLTQLLGALFTHPVRTLKLIGGLIRQPDLIVPVGWGRKAHLRLRDLTI